MRNTIAFGSGHRPEDSAGLEHYLMVGLAKPELIKRKVRVAICGMAAGFDLAFGCAAMDLGLELWCARPWAGHKPRKKDRMIYFDLIDYAEEVHNVNRDDNYPGPWVYQERNEFMVDSAHLGIVFWNGKQTGGTWNCLEYANKVATPYFNVYPEELMRDVPHRSSGDRKLGQPPKSS